MWGLLARQGPECRPLNLGPARKSLRENLLDNMTGAPGLAFETGILHAGAADPSSHAHSIWA